MKKTSTNTVNSTGNSYRKETNTYKLNDNAEISKNNEHGKESLENLTLKGDT